MRLPREWILKRIAFCAVAILLFSISIISAQDLDKINKLAQECQSGIEKACAKLAKIAKNDKDLATCLAALEKLGNHSLVQDITWNANYHSVRKTAYYKMNDKSSRRGTVSKLTDQVLLAEIAKNTSEYFEVRLDAIKKVSDVQVIAEIAKNEKNEYVRQAAGNRLPTGHPLRRIVKATVSEIESLEDQSLLVEIAKNAHDASARIAAAKKLSDKDPGPLAEIVKNSLEDISARLVAVKILNDQILLAEIAVSDAASAVRVVAIEKLENQSLFAKLAISDGSYEVREAALRKMTDQIQLADIAMNAKNHKTREEAVKKITDPLLLADIARTSDIPQIRGEAIMKITDQSLLADIFKKDSIEWVRIRALNKLSSQAILESVFHDGQQPYNIRFKALSLLRDSGRFKIGQDQVVQTLFEMRQEALRQKNHDLYKKINSNSTQDNLVDMRMRAPKATIQGQLINREDGKPLAQTSVFLGEMKSNRECMLYSDLMTTTDDKGHFVLGNVPNGYYTVVYSWSEKPKLPTASVFILDSIVFNTSIQNGLFNAYNQLTEGTSTVSSMELGLSLSFEVRNSKVVEFDVFGTGIKKLVFEIY